MFINVLIHQNIDTYLINTTHKISYQYDTNYLMNMTNMTIKAKYSDQSHQYTYVSLPITSFVPIDSDCCNRPNKPNRRPKHRPSLPITVHQLHILN